MRDQLMLLLVCSSVEPQVRRVVVTAAGVPRRDTSNDSDTSGARVCEELCGSVGVDDDGHSRCAAGYPSGGEVPTSSRRGKEGWCSVVWQAMGPAENCVVIRNLVRALLEEFVVGASRAARVTRALWIGGPLTLEPQPITADSPSGVLETRGFQVQTA